MDFVNLHQPLDEDEEALESYEEPVKPKKKRRKTTGDEPSTNSKYHTQTITQLDWSFISEQDVDDSIFDIPSSSSRSKELRRKNSAANPHPPKPAIQRSSRRKSAPTSPVVLGSMAPPQTPHRRPVQEIPSSESPATPPSRSSPLKGSILRERSTNIPISFSTNNKLQLSPSKLPKLRVEDTFGSDDVSQQTRIPTTPSKRSSPAKTVRFASLEILKDVDAPPVIHKALETRSVTSKKSSMQLMDEILDSDAESDEDYEIQEDSGPSEEYHEEHQPETCYGEIGLETQKLLEIQKRPSPQCIEESQIPGGEIPEELVVESSQFMESQILEEEVSEEALEKTQYMESQRLATQLVHAMAPRTKFSDAFVSIRPQDVTKIVDLTKDHEFRHQMIPETVSRIWIYETYPTRTLKYMAAISAAKRPGEIVNESGVGNAEFNAKGPDCGEFAWEILELYELADPLPWATIASNEWLSAPPKKPTLLRPAVLDQLMANLKPPLFCRAPQPELPTSSSTDTQDAEEQLLSTMIQHTQQLPSTEALSSQVNQEDDEDDEEDLDGEDEDDEEAPHSRPPNSSRRPKTPSRTLLSQTMKQESQNDEERPQSTPQDPTQGTMAPPREHGTPFALPQLPCPSQAETVDLSQSQTPRNQSSADIVFESPTRPIFSSTPINLPTPRERENVGPNSLIPYSMSSSQLLTKSQMLPESLLNDSVPGPPLFIQDSDEEDY